MPTRKEATDLLILAGGGDQNAYDELALCVYDELRALARKYLRRERAGHTLQPTELVHEAYMRMVDQKRAKLKNQTQFLRIAARMMRRILVDYARKHISKKRGEGASHLSLSQIEDIGFKENYDLIAIDEALEQFAAVDPRKCRIVELRFFAGLPMKKIGEILNISTRTVELEWSIARVWLFHKLGKGEEGGSRTMEKG